MSVRKRKWVTRKGEPKEAWIIDYTDQDGDRHIEPLSARRTRMPATRQ
jgi:integrase